MFLEIILAIIIGILAGIFTGLIPGIHTNLVAIVLISLSPLLLNYTSPVALAAFIIAISITNSFVDAIPSIFLGAPESEMALGVLPGHRYLLKGWGYQAVKLTLIGSFGAVILGITLFPLSIPLVKILYPIIEGYIAYLLILVAVFMVLRDNKKLWALFVFFLAGTFGLIVLNMPSLSQPLFPMLSGLFGISTLLYSLNETNTIPKQEMREEIKISKWITFKALLSGQFSGSLTGMLPGLGAAQAAIISMQITRKLGDHGFMILIGSINTFNFIFSIATWYAIDKSRNGSIVAVAELIDSTTLTIPLIVVFLCATLISGAVSVWVTLRLARVFSTLMNKVDYKKMVITVIAFICVLCLFLSGPLGFFVLIVSTAIGLIPAIIKVTRTHSMACLLLPVILYFLL